jgi:NosR/NirI family nitrous oxide reductase transcriptional regulator
VVKRIDWRELSRRAGLPFLAFTLVTWVWAWKTGAERPEPDLYPFLKRAWPGADYVPLSRGLFEVKQGGHAVGYAAMGTASGYSGPLTLAVGTSPDGRVRSLAILEYRDTPDLMRGATRLLGSLLDRSPADGFEVGRDVDAVTGATFSSRGLALAAREAAQAAAERGAARPAGGRAPFRLGAPEVVLVLLLVAGTLGRHRPGLPPRSRTFLRTGMLLAGLATLGFLWNQPWTIAFPTRLLGGDWPSWTTHLYWYLLLAGTLLVFDRTGQSPYCPSVCPFGAAQDVIGLTGGARRRRVPAALLFTWVKRGLLWLAVLLGLLYRSPGATSYEVFEAFFRLSGTGFQYAILGFVVAASVFFRRPFCSWLCPVDAVERAARPLRSSVLRLMRGRKRLAHLRRPILLPMASASGPVVPVFRRLRNGLLTAVGLVCALLVLGHFHERLGAGGRAAQDGLMGRTFVTSGSAEPNQGR